jgi:hypothetical protein
VESWVPAMPRQEIYLAVLDEQASLPAAEGMWDQATGSRGEALRDPLLVRHP